MGSFFSFLIHPFDTIRPRNNEDEGSLDDLLYHLTLFFAFGIWTVIRRYQTARNRAIPFKYAALEVCSIWNQCGDEHILRRPPFALQAADPNYANGIFITNPTLQSHNYNTDIGPMHQVADREYITSFDPATGLHLHTLPADEALEIGEKIERAAHAQTEWKNTTFADRRRVMRSLKKWLVENQDVCAQTACRDTGKTRTFL